MPRNPELMRRNMKEMSLALEGADATLIENFLYSLLTPSEADEMAKRWALVKRLAEGKPQRRIAEELGLSLCKITRGSRELKKEGAAFRILLDRIKDTSDQAVSDPGSGDWGED
ncbi:MAG: Trp family transcriptional regulator [Spirochaetia bacterium]|jgi:TrpR family trp operon transcriptional repressor|nr:Trp family transcriptional regulator [Spirochaetia bacterium]